MKNTSTAASRECRVVSATGSLGVTPFHEGSFQAALQRNPHAIGADAGSGDIGPSFLGGDISYPPAEWEKRDLELLVQAALDLDVPLIVGSAGGAGTNSAVDRYAAFVREAVQRSGHRGIAVARIYAEVPLAYLEQRARAGEVMPLGFPGPLSQEAVRASSRVVAMMGVEPLLEAMRRGAQIIVAGRATDDAVFAAVPMLQGFDKATALHMGKLIECASIVATPPLMRETVMGTVRENGQNEIIISAIHPDQRCTPASVAGHSMYERPDPTELLLPGGRLDLSHVTFETHDRQSTKVTGATFVPADFYAVKLEGAGWVGERAFTLFAFRDPISIAHIDEILTFITDEAARVLPGVERDRDYRLVFHIYGRDGVMGALEPVKHIASHEVAVVAEIVGPTREFVERLGALVKYASLRAYYKGKLGTAGGAAFLQDEIWFSPRGAFHWTVDHLLPLSDPLELFPISLEEV
ncbi:MAG TPA: acyclic terpene utilization AtuA family protein [bacterium]|jgi:hypothetical protein